jgi:hypothetical protein
VTRIHGSIAALVVCLSSWRVASMPFAGVEAISPAPRPMAVWVMASLGDRGVASDVVWLQVVQRLGRQREMQAGFPHLERWLELLSELDPRFDRSYLVAAAFLSGDPTRADRVARLLARGREALPGQFQIEMAEGFVQYFGRGDLAAAADAFERASVLPGAPSYLVSFTASLRRAASACSSMRQTISSLRAHSLQAPHLRESLVACYERELKRGAAAFRLQHGRDGTVEELVTLGFVQDLSSPPGECWSLTDGSPSLQPCSAQ